MNATDKDGQILSFLSKSLHQKPIAITNKEHHHESIKDTPLPYIPLKPNLVIGRPHLNILPAAACGCLKRLEYRHKWEPGCTVCNEMSSFVLKYTSMKMFKFRWNETENYDDECKNVWSVEWIGRNENLVYINGSTMKRGVRYPISRNHGCDVTIQLRNPNGIVISEYVIDYITIESEKEPSTVESCIDLVSSPDDDETLLSTGKLSRGMVCPKAIFFLHRGLNMTSTRIQKLTQILERNMTGEHRMEIQTTFDPNAIPKYLVIDPDLSKEIVRSALDFKDLKTMAIALVDVFIIKPEFIMIFRNLDHPPPPQYCLDMMEDIRMIYNRLQIGPKHTSTSSSEWLVRKRPMTEFATVQTISASSSACHFVKQMKMQKSSHLSSILGRNEELSQLLEKISLMYKESPIDKHDIWRSYMYKICSTRLLHLDFEVTLAPDCMKRLQKIKGFGSSIQQTIRDFLLFDKCDRLKALESDIKRKGMRNMSKIWGVGSATALELVNQGYYTIEDIREAIALGELKLTNNQNIGVKYYEDFQEKMSRHETREIGKKVTEAVKRFFFDAEVMIMGSYRRGLMQNGDIDVLITLPKYKYGDDATPNGALDELVERLKEERYISYHLTSVDPEYHRRMPSQDEDFIDDYLPKYGHQTYMGVFNSPYFPGKMRRIDIKFYPYRDKAFAMLYFTGNGYFNRAMRLYAKQAKQMKLNDCGLYVMSLGREVKRIECKTEKDIFNALGLIYFDPRKRDGMDAIRIKDDDAPGGSLSQVHPTEEDVLQDSQHAWIE